MDPHVVLLWRYAMFRVTRFPWVRSLKCVCTCVNEGSGVHLAVSMLASILRSVHCCAECAYTHKLNGLSRSSRWGWGLSRHRLIVWPCLGSAGKLSGELVNCILCGDKGSACQKGLYGRKHKRHVLSCVKIVAEIGLLQMVWSTGLLAHLRRGRRLLRTAEHIFLVCVIIALGELAVTEYG